MCQEEVAVAEPPKDADTGEACIPGSGNIHIAVTDVNSSRLVGLQLSQRLKHRVRSRLLADSLSLVLTNGDINHTREEMTAQFAGGSMKLVAHYSHLPPTMFQFGKELENAFVGTGMVKRMGKIIFLEGSESSLELRVQLTIGHRPQHEATHTIANKLAYLLTSALWHLICAQSMIHRLMQVVESIK